jgi:hypothetical protein
MIGVNVMFDYDGDFDRSRVTNMAETAPGMFEGIANRWRCFDAARRADQPAPGSRAAPCLPPRLPPLHRPATGRSSPGRRGATFHERVDDLVKLDRFVVTASRCCSSSRLCMTPPSSAQTVGNWALHASAVCPPVRGSGGEDAVYPRDRMISLVGGRARWRAPRRKRKWFMDAEGTGGRRCG